MNALEEGDHALVTSPDRIQRVQAKIRCVAPLTTARTVWRLGRNTRLVLLFA